MGECKRCHQDRELENGYCSECHWIIYGIKFNPFHPPYNHAVLVKKCCMTCDYLEHYCSNEEYSAEESCSRSDSKNHYDVRTGYNCQNDVYNYYCTLYEVNSALKVNEV